jgi:indolepyruvate decarboxylase
VRQNVPAIVVVLDNGLYAIEQFVLDRQYFNTPSAPARSYLNLPRWNYADLAASMGLRRTWTVNSATGLKDALLAAKAETSPVLIHAKLRPHDLPSELKSA